METLSNNLISIAVNDHGAELASIRHAGREYLWQADKAFWQRHSPVLFPIVGSVWGGEFRAKGITYKMGQHGFARDMDFVLIDRTDSSVRYRLQSTPETLAKYPFDFILEISYTIDGNRIRVGWHVENPGEEVLPFQIGAHPAFYWPMLSDAQIEAGVEAMAAPLADTDSRGYFRILPVSKSLPKSVISEGGCVGGKAEIKLADDGYLPLSVATFSRDALVVEDSLIQKVTLCDEDKRPYVSLEFTAPLVGLWSPPGKRAPFVCIEPWYGRCDSVGYEGDFADRKWMQHLNQHQSFDAFYDIIIELASEGRGL